MSHKRPVPTLAEIHAFILKERRQELETQKESIVGEMKKIFCDMCGKEVIGDCFIVTLGKPLEYSPLERECADYELDRNCYNKIAKMFGAETPNPHQKMCGD